MKRELCLSDWHDLALRVLFIKSRKWYSNFYISHYYAKLGTYILDFVILHAIKRMVDTSSMGGITNYVENGAAEERNVLKTIQTCC